MIITNTPTLSQSVESLRGRDDFQAIVQFIRDERERFFLDLRQCENERDVMKCVGSVATLDDLVQILS